MSIVLYQHTSTSRFMVQSGVFNKLVRLSRHLCDETQFLGNASFRMMRSRSANVEAWDSSERHKKKRFIQSHRYKAHTNEYTKEAGMPLESCIKYELTEI